MRHAGHMVLIVDAANVVGSRPDGWWRDRLGAARRLRDALAPVGEGLPGLPGPLTVVLVVEGRARGLANEPGPASVEVVAASGSGDDEIVSRVRAAAGPPTVVTADRGLRERVQALGAAVLGPRSLPY